MSVTKIRSRGLRRIVFEDTFQRFVEVTGARQNEIASRVEERVDLAWKPLRAPKLLSDLQKTWPTCGKRTRPEFS
jgi:hypothetical protein